MTEATDLFFRFQQLWRSGKDASLKLTCHAGQVQLNLQVYLPNPPPHPYPAPPPPPPRPPRASRQRRRARRAAAREQTAVNAANQSNPTAEAFVQTDENNVIKNADAAVQVAFDKLPPILHTDLPPQAPLHLAHHLRDETTAQVGREHYHVPPAHPGAAVNAADLVQVQPNRLTPVPDIFCPDTEYYPAGKSADIAPVICSLMAVQIIPPIPPPPLSLPSWAPPALCRCLSPALAWACSETQKEKKREERSERRI